MIAPKKLKQGDTVALLSASGPCSPERIDPALESLKRWGLKAFVMESCYLHRGYLAGSDEKRAADVMAAFANPAVNGIFAFRGGYGAQRVLPRLDFETIRKHPKIFAGYSDATALHVAFNQRSGLITYHAPMIGSELCLPRIDAFTVDSFLQQVMDGGSPSQTGAIQNPPDAPLMALVPGCACGLLVGGNLSLLAASLGTPYEVDTADKVLFLEEVQEAPYRIDRMLLQLKLAGKLDACQGILLGSFWPETYESVWQAVEDLLLPLGKPVWGNLACGHCLPTVTLPLGAQVCVDEEGIQFSTDPGFKFAPQMNTGRLQYCP